MTNRVDIQTLNQPGSMGTFSIELTKSRLAEVTGWDPHAEGVARLYKALSDGREQHCTTTLVPMMPNTRNVQYVMTPRLTTVAGPIYMMEMPVGSRADQPKPWAARITGADPKYGLAREFITPMNDWIDARRNFRGEIRGIVAHFPLRNGVHEICGSDGAREFIRVAGGEKHESDWLGALQSVYGRTGAEHRVAETDGPMHIARVRGLGMPEIMGWVVRDGERCYWLPPGLYESVAGIDRTLFVVARGDMTQVTDTEAIAWLGKR